MAFTINKNLVFIDNKQFMNSSLEKLSELSDNDFKYLSEEFNSEQMKLVKQKGVLPMNSWTVLKYFLKINYLIRNTFINRPKINISVKKIICMLSEFGINLK